MEPNPIILPVGRLRRRLLRARSSETGIWYPCAICGRRFRRYVNWLWHTEHIHLLREEEAPE